MSPTRAFLPLVLVLFCCLWGGVQSRHRNRQHAEPKFNYSFPVSQLAIERNSEFVTKGKICIGTNGRMSVPSNRDHHYRNLKERYTNCTYVDGNLELTWLQDDSYDLKFLKDIREVTGYVLISHVDIRRIVLPNLQIIRGRTFFKLQKYNQVFALLVTHSKMYSLNLPKLRDVLSGSVGFFNNYNLCHIKTINWKEIITDPNGEYKYAYNFTSPERECDCDKSCEAGCWAEGPENCQKFSKENCSPQCSEGRCYGPKPRECCHIYCAGGCVGPKQSDCIACRNFYDDGVCVSECPAMQIYNPITYSWEPNPKGKYAYGATCVKNCPEHLLKDNGACVRQCPPNKKAVNSECVPCNGPCPKTCQGDIQVNSANIDSFKECTIIEGYLLILENSFTGYQQIYTNYSFGPHYEAMHPDRLEVFSTLKEITGYINIQADHKDFKNLSYFRNLEIIGGRETSEMFSALYIVKTSLQSLGLTSLRTIKSGSVSMLENKNLCFANSVNFTQMVKSKEHKAIIKNNRDPLDCQANGLVCSKQCSDEGCMGPGEEECLSCRHYKLGMKCIQNCSIIQGIYDAGNKECKPCHDQCRLSCTGPGPEHCTACKYVKDGPFCVQECPKGKYVRNGVCEYCHKNCVEGCTGPLNIVGEGGCNSCDKAVMNDMQKLETCLHKTENCPDGYFEEWVRPEAQDFLKALDGKAICRKCHPRCKKCTSYGFHQNVCQQCTNYKKGEQCEDECPFDHYPDEATQECVPCDDQCRGCTGPGPGNCTSCNNFKVFEDGDPLNNSSFTCVAVCPSEYPHRIFPQDSIIIESYCSAEEAIPLSIQSGGDSSTLIIVIVAVPVLIILSIITIAALHVCRKYKDKETALKMTMALTGLEDNEPLRPSNVMPNLAKLRIIKEVEIRKGDPLGYGAFGTVFKGFWVPEGENNKIPVAIKVLREDTGANTSKDFLAEAYIMATVDHPNLLQLLAVCMTSQMMLITQLMPLGCLLDFVRNEENQPKISSKRFLTWCTQIARGMAYLEEKRLVHRDLAARNVLVQTPACVKITDFGLAKLLEINEEEYRAEGGKMPIRWLALECIQHRIFTHKSDVWAFGVTVWELLTYGGRPYDNVPARDVPELLEKGERLPQPAICSIDVYMIMIKCWMLDAENRPGFKELTEDFAKMTRDPGRYLAIAGDLHSKVNSPQDHTNTLGSTVGSSVIENSGTHSEGDDYLQPKSRAPLPPYALNSLSRSPPTTPIKKFWASGSHMTSDGSCAPQNQHNWNQERLRYAQARGLNSVHHSNSDGSSLRHCGDSMQKEDYGSDEYDAARSQAHVGNVKLNLLLDEDDYLMPSPQQNQNYVDLIEDTRIAESALANASRIYPEFSTTTNIDNPEYLMSSDAPSQAIGIPTISELVHSTTTSEPTSPNPAQTFQPQRSSEEESDHEYYNDFDRLQRELQPLHRKGETTV